MNKYVLEILIVRKAVYNRDYRYNDKGEMGHRIQDNGKCMIAGFS